MDEFDRQLLAENPEWRQVLRLYQDRAVDPGEPSSESTLSGPRWVDRLESVEGIENEELSAIHGQLIALGWLKFQFEVGQSGLMYRVSSEGRQLMAQLAVEPVAQFV